MHLLSLHLVRRTSRLAALALLAAALTGCQVIDGTPLYTQVRVIAASPDAPGLDVYQNTTASLYNIGFGTASSYIAISPGTYTYSVDITGTRQQLASVAAPLAIGSQYTVLIGNVTANLQMTVLKDQSTPAPSGQVALRFLDQSTRNGPVDIYLLPSGGKLTGITPIVNDIRFGNITTYIDAPIGTYSIVVLPTGTIPGNATTSLYTGSQIEYSTGAARTIVLIDQQMVTTPGLQVITADDYDSPSATS
jgi:Domain of unknown function (DUF4397)